MPELPAVPEPPRKSYDPPTVLRVTVSAQSELLQATACAANQALGCPPPLFS